MRSEREEAMQRHPSSGVAVVDRPDDIEVASPYRQFIEGLEELSMVISLYGTSSLEAREARANVRRLRENAATAWRQRSAAA